MTPQQEDMIEKEAESYKQEIYKKETEGWDEDLMDRCGCFSEQDCDLRKEGYIAGRSASIESEKAKDERIKILEDGLRKLEAKTWHKSEWKEMEEINIYVRQLLNNNP